MPEPLVTGSLHAGLMAALSLQKRSDRVFIDKDAYKEAQQARKKAEKELAGELMQAGLTGKEARSQARLQLCEKEGIIALAPKKVRNAYDKQVFLGASVLLCNPPIAVPSAVAGVHDYNYDYPMNHYPKADISTDD